MPSKTNLPVVLFGYEASPFTTKVRMACKLKQIPYTFVPVPSMMPRPLLRSAFNLTYRKIPVLCIGRDLYVDTALILEALEARFGMPEWGTLYPDTPLFPNSSSSTSSLSSSSSSSTSSSSSAPTSSTTSTSPTRPLIRILASHYTDRPLFRLTTGLIPPSVWASAFGQDRAKLIGHPLDPVKLGRKTPANAAALHRELSILEPLSRAAQAGQGAEGGWLLGTKTPSLLDIALFYQLDWGVRISRGDGAGSLTGGRVSDGDRGEGMDGAEAVRRVFSAEKFPGLMGWFARVEAYFSALPPVERKVRPGKETEDVLAGIAGSELSREIQLVPTAVSAFRELDEEVGLREGERVSVAPDDTGRADPTFGRLLRVGAEEVVVSPERVDGHGPGVGEVRIHFPRVGFRVRSAGKGRENL